MSAKFAKELLDAMTDSWSKYATVRGIHARLLALCRGGGARIDKIYYCPHRPDQGCSCRKPRTGMLKAARRDFRLDLPGSPSGGGTDHASFICAGAPAVGLNSEPWDYFSYTWHTNRDTYDKVAMENVRDNAVLVAMLAYLAAEDPETVSREQRVLGINRRTGGQAEWPACQQPDRAYSR